MPVGLLRALLRDLNHLQRGTMNGGKLLGRVVSIENVTRRQREQMFALMTRYYDGVRRAEFDADLDEKQWVIHVTDAATGSLRGFSTQRLLEVECGGRTLRALFSGDTVVDRQCWSGNPLAQVWGRFALGLIESYPSDQLFWFLITKGFRTYRFLPLFFHEFFPRVGVATPPWANEAIDALGRARYPHAYDSASGVVRAAGESCRLRTGVGEVTESRIADPHVRFFVERNPGHARGDELCCLAPLTRENFTPAAHRTIGLPAACAASVSSEVGLYASLRKETMTPRPAKSES